MDLDELSSASGELFAARYRIEKLLGNGGMGKVYLATDTMLSEKVALKVLHAQLCQDEKHTKRFLREVQLTRKVTHPNIVRTHDVGIEKDRLYFTMEYVEGISLRDKMGPEKLSSTEAAVILLGILKGLSAIHQAEIVHRDLKPGNVILTTEGVPKITDFGVARPGISTLTGNDEIVGSIPYMAPEIWSGQEVTPATDIYALGVLAYELLTGVLPFDGETPAELMCKHLEAAAVPPIDLVPEIPPWLSDFTLQMLVKDMPQRLQTSQTCISILETHLFDQAPQWDDAFGMQNTNLDPNVTADAIQNIETGSTDHSSGGLLFAIPPQLDPQDTLVLSGAQTQVRSGIAFIVPAPQTKAPHSAWREFKAKSIGLMLLCIFSIVVWAVLTGPFSAFLAWFLSGSGESSRSAYFFTLAWCAGGFCMLTAIPVIFLMYLRKSAIGSLEAWFSTSLALFAAVVVLFGTRLMWSTASHKLGEERMAILIKDSLETTIHAATLIPDSLVLVSPKIRVIRSRQAFDTTQITLAVFQIFYLTFLLSMLSREHLGLKRRPNLIAFGAITLLVGIFTIIDGLILTHYQPLFADTASLPIKISIGPFAQTFAREAILSSLLKWLLIFACVTVLLKRLSAQSEENSYTE